MRRIYTKHSKGGSALLGCRKRAGKSVPPAVRISPSRWVTTHVLVYTQTSWYTRSCKGFISLTDFPARSSADTIRRDAACWEDVVSPGGLMSWALSRQGRLASIESPALHPCQPGWIIHILFGFVLDRIVCTDISWRYPWLVTGKNTRNTRTLHTSHMSTCLTFHHNVYNCKLQHRAW